MGLNFVGISRSSCCCEDTPIQASPANPNPDKYDILDKYEYTNNSCTYVVLLIKYVGCTNYEGQKILLYQNCTFMDLMFQKTLDPHFCDNPNHIYPIARFIPTLEGWEMALRFVQTCNVFHPYSIKRQKIRPEKIPGTKCT